MKVALIASDNNASSGAFLSLANMAVQLNRLGVETIVFIPPDGPYVGPGDGERILKQYQLEYRKIPSITWIVPEGFKPTMLTTLGQLRYRMFNKYQAHKLARILKSEQVDLVHINTVYSYYAAYAAKYAGLPLVWHIREFLEEDQEKKFYFKEYAYKLINCADLVIAISNSIYQKYAPNLTTQVKTIYNGIDVNKFYKPMRCIFTSEITTLCYVGGLSPLKGTDDLLEACKKLNNAGKKQLYRLIIAGRGDDPYEKKMRDFISENQMDNVEFVGYQKDVPAVMSRADVSVVTSRYEAFGRVTVEAMLTGNLVLGADSAGTKELLHDGEFGVLYHCGDADSIKDRVLYILEHKKELEEKACMARFFMAENMTAEKNAENIYKEYVRILGEYKR